jgi:mannosyltransferase
MGEVTLAPPTPAPATPAARRDAAWTERATYLYWLVPALLTLGIGLWRVGRPALWADELATWGAVRLSWSQLFDLLGNVDAAVGPYYVLLKLWTTVAGTGDLALRLPSVLAMAGTAALVAVLGARLAGSAGSAGTAGSAGAARTAGAARWTGLLAGLLFTVVPATSRYGQEARPYAAAMLLACAATLALIGLLERPGPLRAAGYGACVLLLGAAHVIAVLLVFAHAVPVLRARQRRTLLAWLVPTGIALLLLSPLAVLGLRQRAQISWIPALTWQATLSVPATIFATSAVGGAVIVLAALVINRRPGTVTLLSWALVPPVVLALMGLVGHVFWARYLLFTMPAWVLLAALALSRLPAWRAVLAGLMIFLLGAPTQVGVRDAAGHTHATAQAAAIIATHQQPGDALAVALNEAPEPWEARDLVARYVPAARRPLDIFAVTPQRTNGKLTATECPDPAACLDRANPQRIWVIRFQTQADPLAGIGEPKENLLRSRYHTDHLWFVRGLTVALLVRNLPPS